MALQLGGVDKTQPFDNVADQRIPENAFLYLDCQQLDLNHQSECDYFSDPKN